MIYFLDMKNIAEPLNAFLQVRLNIIYSFVSRDFIANGLANLWKRTLIMAGDDLGKVKQSKGRKVCKDRRVHAL